MLGTGEKGKKLSVPCVLMFPHLQGLGRGSAVMMEAALFYRISCVLTLAPVQARPFVRR